MLFKYSIALVTFFNFLAWLLVLGGISALEDVCHGGCRAAYGLPWFIIWYQFILLIPAFLIEVSHLLCSLGAHSVQQARGCRGSLLSTSLTEG